MTQQYEREKWPLGERSRTNQKKTKTRLTFIGKHPIDPRDFWENILRTFLDGVGPVTSGVDLPEHHTYSQAW